MTVSPKIGENIELLVCFICMGTQGLLLYQLLIFLNLLIVYLFRQRDWKKTRFYLRLARDYCLFHPASGWETNNFLSALFLSRKKNNDVSEFAVIQNACVDYLHQTVFL